MMSHATVASRSNLDALEATYQRWRQDPESVDEVLDLRKMTEIGVPGGAHGSVAAG